MSNLIPKINITIFALSLIFVHFSLCTSGKSRASLLLDKAQVRTARRPTHTVRNPAAPFFLCARSMRPGPGPVATGTGRMVVGWHELGWHELGSRYECTGARTPERSAVPGARLLAGELADRKECISRVRLQPPRVCLNGSLLLGAWSSLWTTRPFATPQAVASPPLVLSHARLVPRGKFCADHTCGPPLHGSRR